MSSDRTAGDATHGSRLRVGHRFRGPARSGNGGYTAGLLAQHVGGGSRHPVVEVTLRQPPPLDVEMSVARLGVDDAGNATGGPLTVLLMGGARIAEAREVGVHLEPVEAVSPAAAEDAMSRFPGLVSHPFPTCFSCGTGREEGDGLRIFPGPVDSRVASTWVPHPSLAEPAPDRPGPPRVGPGTTWAALDCVGGWAGDLEGRRMVLGRMTAQLDALPVVGEPHVVVGRELGASGRKTFTASTIYDSDERIVARAEHVWIAVDPDRFN